MKNLTIQKLNELYTLGDEVDKSLYAEQRTNILLCSGEHYARRNRSYFNRIRENQSLSLEHKLRLTKNHIQKIIKLYVNNITSYAPGVCIVPENKKELQDQKAAELSNSVWQWAKNKHKLKAKIRNWANDFFVLGECATKIFWNPNKGEFLGYEGIRKEDGSIEATDRPVFSGDLEFERLYAFNLFRSVDAQTWDDSPFVGVKKLMNRKEAKEIFGPEKAKLIDDAVGDQFIVFESSSGSYKREKDQVLVKEIYFKPSVECEKGYYYIFTNAGILEQGELPFGIFPIVIQTCEENQTNPRGISPIKHARPYQVEINRAASKQAEHQITLGDDKLVLMNGSKITQGAQLPGVRTMQITGQPPTILEGRSGAQYTDYILGQISELYSVMMLPEALDDKVDGQTDPFALLYKNLRQKKRFSMYIEKFEEFLVSVCETYLNLARHYFDENTIIPMIGRKEIVNISEFKNQDPLSYRIVVEPISDDIETMMGKQLTLNQLLQYGGQNLSSEDIGKIIKNMPFANAEEIFSDLTLDYESANNIILALDRGQFPEPKPQMNKAYILKRLTARQLQSDYEFLPDEVKANYDEYIRLLNMIMAKEAESIRASQADLIPAQGFLTACDFYVPDPNNPGKNRRARIPIDSLSWLVKRLEEQGVYLNQLENLQQSAQAGVADAVIQSQQSVAAAGAEAQGQVNQSPEVVLSQLDNTPENLDQGAV
jgi:hypothetical protein